MATAGEMWLPVPPAAKMTRTASFRGEWVSVSWVLGCLRERRQVGFKSLKWRKERLEAEEEEEREG